jgi:hypothetical protein
MLYHYYSSYETERNSGDFNYKFACCSMWVGNMICDIKGGPWTEGI